jgi:hypothetical protein
MAQAPGNVTAEREPLPYEDISRTIVVRHFQTPAERLRSFGPREDAGTALAVLSAGNFDYAPVLEHGAVVGRVSRKACAAASSVSVVGSLAEPLSASMLISADTEIGKAIRALAEDPWLLVVGGRAISGVVTPSDLNKQAARAYFYLLLASFEMGLADVVRDVFADQRQALAKLTNERSSRVALRYARAATSDVDSDLVSAMDLFDLVHLGCKSREVRAAFGVGSRASWERLTGSLPSFRNRVMHPPRPLLQGSRGLRGLIDAEERLRGLLGRLTLPR